MIEWNGGIKLLSKPIWFDSAVYGEICLITSARIKDAFRFRRGVSSHQTYCLLQALSPTFRCLRLPYGAWMEVGGIRLSLLPSGFMPGASLVLAEVDNKRFLFINRIVLDAVLWEKAVVPRADVLAVVTPYGSSQYSFHSRKEIYDTIVSKAQDSIKSGQSPIFLTSAIGKAQEVTKILLDNGFDVVVHKSIARVCNAYKAIGVTIGKWKVFRGRLGAHQVLVFPDHLTHSSAIKNVINRRLIWLSGMAVNKSAREVLGVDEGICLSGYPDIPGLVKLVALSHAKKVYLIGHNMDDALTELKKKGVETHSIRWERQMTLF